MTKTLAALAVALALSACADPAARSGGPSYSPASATPPALSGAANALTIGTWQWQRTDLPGARAVVAAAPERYTLEFQGGGRLLVRADCNRGTGAYEVDGASMKIAPVALTRMGCPAGTQDTEFVQPLSRVTSYAVDGRELVLTLSDGGAMRLRGMP